MVFKLIKKVFPLVDQELNHWKAISEKSGDATLGEQAAASIDFKRFHAQGGCVFSLYPGVDTKNMVKLITAFQTISDYLDNLCDRNGIAEEKAFRQLHLSMLDAVDPDRPLNDYYSGYPFKHDNDYLKKLVLECREQVCRLPSYHLVLDSIKKYVYLYSELQCLKHLSKEIREDKLMNWWQRYSGEHSLLYPWEFYAATGSTLGIFCLFAASSSRELTECEVLNIETVYFPWICSLHILLDYYIDAEEDYLMGDLNFTQYYQNLKQVEERLIFFLDKSLESLKLLSFSDFHITLVRGLLAMYLSDIKAFHGLNKITTSHVLKKGGFQTGIYHALCKILRHYERI